jgi:hypothetical protein
MGRFLPVVTVRDFSSSASCYAELRGRDQPDPDIPLSCDL